MHSSSTPICSRRRLNRLACSVKRKSDPMPTRRIAHLTEASYNVPYENIVGKTAGAAGELGYQSLSETWEDAIRGRAGSPGTRTHRRQHQKDLPRFAGGPGRLL